MRTANSRTQAPEQQAVPGQRRCIGFGANEGICTYAATVEPALLWCQGCEAKRLEHLDKAFDSIDERFRDV